MSEQKLKNNKKKFDLKKRLTPFLTKNPKLILLLRKILGSSFGNQLDPFTRFHTSELFETILKDKESFLNLKATGQNKKKYIITDSPMPEEYKKIGKIIRSLDEIPKSEIKNSLFFIYFICDSDALPVLNKIIDEGGEFIPHIHFNSADVRTSYRFVNRLAYNALKKTWSLGSRVSHLDTTVHENICEALELTKNIEGDYVEIGVYLGGSALTALNYLTQLRESGNENTKKAWLIDTFDGFNYDEAKESADVIWTDTHKLFGVEETKKYISETFSDIEIPFELVAGNICSDNLPTGIKKISVANIDVDLYEPTLAALKKVAGYIPKGGIIICEDPAVTPALYGAFLAMNQFLEIDQGKEFMPVFKKGQYFLIKF